MVTVEGANDSDELQTDQKLIYISDRTKRWLVDNIYACGNGDWQCRVCHWKSSKRWVQIHVKQHAVQMFCKYRYNLISRDMVYDHQASMIKAGHSGHSLRPGHIFQANHASYHTWAKDMGWIDPNRYHVVAPLPEEPCERDRKS